MPSDKLIKIEPITFPDQGLTLSEASVPPTGDMLRTPPADVLATLRRHMLADGFDLVLDLDESQGPWFVDARTKERYLDLFGFFASLPLGFNHPKMREPAFLRDLTRASLLKPTNSDVYTPELAEFVETFATTTLPPAFRRRTFFIEGGALAVENALKAAFDWKVQKNFARGRTTEIGTRVIHFRQAFHGRSGYTLSLTNTFDPRKTRWFPKFDWPRIENPKRTFPETPASLAATIALEERARVGIEEALARHGEDIAALIIEPIQSEGGDNHFRPEFLRWLRGFCTQNEIILIFDEVQTGLGGTGRWWAFEHFDVMPDIFAFGKKVQVCGIAATERLDEVESVFRVSSRINSTFGGNLADMVRSRRYIEIIAEDDLLRNVRETGAILLDGLRGIEARTGGKIRNARGLGFLVAFDLPDTDARGRFRLALYRRHLLALPSGECSIRFRPPLDLPAGAAARALEIVEAALAEF